MGKKGRIGAAGDTPSKPMVLNSVEKLKTQRVGTGYEEVDRVLGGGLVKGSLILLRRRTGNW